MTDKLRQAAEETVKKLEHISRKLEGHRVWGGMEWEYHAILPSQYLPLRDFVDSQIKALRQELAEQYLAPGALVPVDMETTTLLLEALRQALAKPPNSTTEVVEPIGEIQIEQMERPFNAGKVVVHFYGEPPPVGAKLYAEPPKRKWQGLTDDELLIDHFGASDD
jgi:hypothetical protein